jgi:hypothetical protein
MRRATITLLVLAWCLCLPSLAAAATAPTIEYSAPSPIRNHEATLHFTIDPEGLETFYEVEIAGIASGFHDWEMPTAIPAGDEPVAIAVTIPRYWEGSLSAGREYHWRVRAWNSAGETIGSEQFFTTTKGPKPVFVNGEATQIGATSVEVTGTVDPEGALLTGCRFRYVDRTTYEQAGFEAYGAVQWIRFGETVPCEESFAAIGSGTEPVTVHAVITGLAPGEYVFRLEGENADEDAISLGGVPFEVAVLPPPVVVPPIPGANPPGVEKAPGLSTAPGLTTAPGLQKPRP